MREGEEAGYERAHNLQPLKVQDHNNPMERLDRREVETSAVQDLRLAAGPDMTQNYTKTHARDGLSPKWHHVGTGSLKSSINLKLTRRVKSA